MNNRNIVKKPSCFLKGFIRGALVSCVIAVVVFLALWILL